MYKELIKIFKSNSLYDQALESCHSMLDNDLIMFNASIKSLRESNDSDIDIDIYSMDIDVNKFERSIRRKVSTHLSLGNIEDLSAGLVLVSIVIDIERIGDYTKNIYDLAVHHPKKLVVDQLEDRISKLEEFTSNFFTHTIQAFKADDTELASNLMTSYKEQMSQQSDAIVNDVIGNKIGGITTGEGAAIALYARYLKRISAHSRNLVSSIVNPFDRIGYPEKEAK